MRAGMMILRAVVLIKRGNAPKRSMEKVKDIISIERFLGERGWNKIMKYHAQRIPLGIGLNVYA
jgi:hypothetical protein